MNGGKDIKIGDDKRPVSIIPSNEQNLFNISNGELLTDEFGTPLITEVDTYYTQDATKKRSTSVVFCDKNTPYVRLEYENIGIITATYGDFDVYVSAGVGTTGGGSPVGFGSTTLTSTGNYVNLNGYPYLEVLTIENQESEKNRLYFNTSVGISTILKVVVGDKIFGAGIPDGTFVSRVSDNNTLILSNNTTLTGIQTAKIGVRRASSVLKKSNVVWKVVEQFKESSEVSTSLLGVNRAETQLSLFSNVSSYGLDPDEFEFYSFNSGISFGSWENRVNEIYGNRYLATLTEEVQESAIKLSAFPAPYSFPFGPKFEKLGFYNQAQFQNYLRFIKLGNDLYDYFNTGDGSGYPNDWKKKFLSSGVTTVAGGDVIYSSGITASFSQIDIWTDTWRDIRDRSLIDPITFEKFDFSKVSEIIGSSFDSGNTRPGYSDTEQRYAYLQSRRVFRYQPGRISGFTFGLRVSTETKPGIILEWGISNPTDQYVFRIQEGQLSIIRRSTIPLERSVLERNKLTLFDQTRIVSGDPFDDELYWTIKIPRDKFNGDPLNSNGPSGYLIQPENVTMYKIEFGWYGAIGARFYAYIPTNNGDARWVVIHTLVIENSLGAPCLRDSYFRFKYSLDVFNTGDIRTPQYIYKYGASYYIDGGDEGSSQIYSANSKQKDISSVKSKSLIGVRPKEFLLNNEGVEIENKKLIIPTQINISSDCLAEIKVVSCSACPGFGHVYTPGIATTEFGRYLDIEFLDANQITSINNSYFRESDIGAKIIAPSIYNAYIHSVSEEVGSSGSFGSATIKGFGGSYGFQLVNRDIGGTTVYDRVAGIVTTIAVGIGSTYPHPIKLSNYDAYAASDFAFTGSKIEIQFVNPNNGDNYAHFADFLIGITDKKPIVTGSSTLLGFQISAGINTTILPNSNILFGEHTHSYASVDENAVETAEGWAPLQPPLRMGIDYRIPGLVNPAGGTCSKLTIEVQDPLKINNANQRNYEPNNSGSTVPDALGRTWIEVSGTLPNIEYNGGQISILDNNNTTNITESRFVGVVSSYVGAGNSIFSYIQVSPSLGSPGSNFTILIRPVNITGTGNINKTKLYNYNPFPLYLVAKLKDYAQINNISVKETIGNFQRTISPQFYVDNKTSIELYGKTDNLGTAPTNFKEITRASSALIDIQNDQELRPYIERDTIYVGANSTETIDMKKIFGADRNVITPDNNNTGATFILAKKIDGAGTGIVEASLNFKEQ